MFGTIYYAFDTSNGMYYVGQTWQDVEKRKRQHLRGVGRSVYFHNALRTRSSSFVWGIMTSGLSSQKDMDLAETTFINELHSLYPDGYNLKEGGRGGRLGEVTKRKMSQRSLGRKKTSEHAKNIGLAQVGKICSSETKAKISATKKANNELRRLTGILLQPRSQETKLKMSLSAKKAWDRRREGIKS